MLLNIQGPAHGFVSLVESIGCEHSICGNNVFIKSSYTGAIVSLTGGSCSLFRNFVRNASVRHIGEKLAVRVHKCDANGKYGRKDMLGITPRLDDNAISYGTSTRRIMDFIDKFPLFGTHSKEMAKLEGRDRVGRQFALWRR